MFYFKDNKGVTVYFANGDVARWLVTDASFEHVCNECKRKNWVLVKALYNKVKTILYGEHVKVDSAGRVTIADGSDLVVLEDDSTLLSMIKLLQTKGVLSDDIKPVRKFLENMVKNTYIDAVHEIYEYCKNMDFEITEDGCFLAYKNVNKDLTSRYDNTTKHAIGEYTEVNIFDSNRNNVCSQGLHFAAKSYLKSYTGDTTIIVKINPMDVVSIPVDYNFTKGRCKRYLTVGIMAKDGTLETTNLKEATGEIIVKANKKAESGIKQHTDIKVDRATETIHNMVIYRNDKEKVAKVMNISVSTVERNIQRYNKRLKEGQSK